MTVATPAKIGGFYVPLRQIPVYEASYEDLECLAITIREELVQMLMPCRPKRTDPEDRRAILTAMIAMIDKAHPRDSSALTVVPDPILLESLVATDLR
jgi:hypothetical protein